MPLELVDFLSAIALVSNQPARFQGIDDTDGDYRIWSHKKSLMKLNQVEHRVLGNRIEVLV